jgi:hypothetical protein
MIFFKTNLLAISQGKGKIGKELGEGEEQQAASTREVRREESQFRFRVQFTIIVASPNLPSPITYTLLEPLWAASEKAMPNRHTSESRIQF